MIKLTETEWAKIHASIAQEYPPSFLLIRDVMRRELGFTSRRHTEWGEGLVHYNTVIYLDFYDDAQETWFRLKYL